MPKEEQKQRPQGFLKGAGPQMPKPQPKLQESTEPMPLRKSYGYWKVWSNVEKEIRLEIAKEYKDEKGVVFKKAGEFPTQQQLAKAGNSGLISAIADYYGGLNAVRRKMGQDTIKVDAGYWEDWNNVETAFDAEIAKEYRDENGVILKKAGEFPTCSQLREAKRCYLIDAAKHHGGINTVRKKMRQSSQVRFSYWKVWDNVEKAFREEIAKEYKDEKGNIFKKAGEFPTDPQLRRADRSDLSNAARHHGGLNAVRRKMEQDIAKVEDGYWKTWGNVESAFRAEIAREYKDENGKAFKKAGEFPTDPQLRRADRSDLSNAARHHGGLRAVKIRMGFAVQPTNFEQMVPVAERVFTELVQTYHGTE